MNRIEVENIVTNALNRAQNGRHNADSSLENAMERMVGAGACRIGVRVKKAKQSGQSACDLASPVARSIDHTLLKAEATVKDIETLCAEAAEHCFASVCINPCHVALSAKLLVGSGVNVCTVIGFPLGATSPAAKGAETRQAIADGANEVDMVVNVGLLRSGEYDAVETDIRAVVDAARMASSRQNPVVVKVILETALLNDEEKVIACVLSQNAGADFVKTSTGFSTSGASLEDVSLMRRVVGSKMGVKASGGIRSLDDAKKMMEHGATRLGVSASIAIVKGEKVAAGGY